MARIFTFFISRSIRNHWLNRPSAYWVLKNYLRQPRTTSSFDVFCKVSCQRSGYNLPSEIGSFHTSGCAWFHAGKQFRDMARTVEPENVSDNGVGGVKMKRKKLKGKRAVVRWLKSFRWKKKKEYERMTAEEKILYKLKKARNKENRLVEALKKIDPPDTTETIHDPEILTPEEHFYFLKMGLKSRNYVPIGRRGIYQGVILNMHLHWKKHQTLKVRVKTFSPEEVRQIAAELARLSGGIVLDIHEEYTIIMYRGKNYVQPPTEIMSPKSTLPRRKALDKSKYRDALRALRKFIPKLEQDLEALREKMKQDHENKDLILTKESASQTVSSEEVSEHRRLAELLVLEEDEHGSNNVSGGDSLTKPGMVSESEGLSDIFETESEGEMKENEEKPLYLDEVEKFPSQNNGETENFEEHLRQISAALKDSNSTRKNEEILELDDIDRLFLRAGSLLRKRRR